jgi:hypothetical protein
MLLVMVVRPRVRVGVRKITCGCSVRPSVGGRWGVGSGGAACGVRKFW